MTNPTSDKPDYGQMLLDGLEEVRQHIAEWGRAEDSTPQRNLAAGWIAGMISEQISNLTNDPGRLALVNVVAPGMLAALAEQREADERG